MTQGKTVETRKNELKTKTPEVKEVEVKLEDGTTEVRPLGKRTPVHKQKAVGIKQRPGYTARQIVEKPGRVEQFLAAGYTLIEDKSRLDNDGRIQNAKGVGDVCREVVNKHNLSPGDVSTAVWVEIPTELYEQDQADKLNRAQELESQIDPRKVQQENPDVYYTSTYKKTYE